MRVRAQLRLQFEEEERKTAQARIASGFKKISEVLTTVTSGAYDVWIVKLPRSTPPFVSGEKRYYSKREAFNGALKIWPELEDDTGYSTELELEEQKEKTANAEFRYGFLLALICMTLLVLFPIVGVPLTGWLIWKNR